MFDFDKIRWRFVFDKMDRALRLLQRASALLVILLIIGSGIHKGLLTETFSGFVYWLISAIAIALFVVLLLFGIEIWFYVIGKSVDWLANQLGKSPEVRRWIITPFAIVLTSLPCILIFTPAFWGISDNLVKAIAFLYALALSSALISVVRDDKKRALQFTMIEATLLNQTPFLSPSDISDAFKMSGLYVILHCYENSVRCLIEKVLSDELGDDWWDKAANDHMKNLVKGRKEAEEKKRWLSPRGQASPLYYLGWGDLEKLIRKYESLFLPYVGELRFVESRFGDLESLRHIVAHHGVLPSDDDFQRVKLSFRDWSRQVGN